MQAETAYSWADKVQYWSKKTALHFTLSLFPFDVLQKYMLGTVIAVSRFDIPSVKTRSFVDIIPLC